VPVYVVTAYRGADVMLHCFLISELYRVDKRVGKFISDDEMGGSRY